MSKRGGGNPIWSRQMEYARMRNDRVKDRRPAPSPDPPLFEPTKYVPKPLPKANLKYKIVAEKNGTTDGITVMRGSRRSAEKEMGMLKRLGKWLIFKLDWE